jgi:hypothetical protein
MNTTIILLIITLSIICRASKPYNEIYNNKIVNGTNYNINSNGRIYTNTLSLAYKHNGIWQLGKTVFTYQLNKGDYIWFPTINGYLEVRQIEHYNITKESYYCWNGYLVMENHINQCRTGTCCGMGCC